MTLRLLLVRHGESVDNAAGLYAGSRDSPLTSHGVLQARRLGAHLASRSATIGPVNHIFASNLQRAVKTAETIAEAQSGADGVGTVPNVAQLPILREKDFGSEEGMRFGRGAQKAGMSSADGWVEPESPQSMKKRVDQFVDNYFVQTAAQAAADARLGSIAIVAHGIILNVLLRGLLTRFGPGEIAKLARPGDAPWRSDWLASWSNTGYLELELRVTTSVAAPEPPSSESTTLSSATPNGVVLPETSASVGRTDAASTPLAIPSGEAVAATAPNIQLFVRAVNCIEHLRGLKKTRGGIGSAGFDEKQRTVDSFFRPVQK